jgi:uncharacterized OsmC-like protein
MNPNNLNVAALSTMLERAKADPAVLKLRKRIEGDWSFREGTPAFSAKVTHGTHESVLHADIAPPFGGAGLAPDPLQYLAFGLGACYAATVVTVATLEGATVTALRVVAENHADVSHVFGLAERPLMEQVTVTVRVSADVDDATLARWQLLAREKCPFAFTVANAIPLETRVERL